MHTYRYQHMPVPVLRTVLDNGLTVFTVQRPSAGVFVELVLPYGSLDDGAFPGTAHFLEHLLYEGPARDGVHPLLRHLVVAGASSNASTSNSATVYWVDGEPEELRDVIRALTVLAFDSDFSDAHVDEERVVILQEHGERALQQRCRLWQRRTLFPHAPAIHHAVMGTPAALRAISSADLRTAYEQWYQPSAAALIIAGGVAHEDVLACVQRQDLCTKPGVGHQRRAPILPTLTRASYTSDDEPEGVALTFAAPEDPVAGLRLGFALNVLCDAPFGILHRALRRERQLVYDVTGARMSWPRLAAHISTQAPQTRFAEIEAIVFASIDALCAEDYPEEVFATIMNRRRRFFTARAEFGNSSWAQRLEDQWLTDDLEDADHAGIVAMTTRADLATIASQYLTREHGCLTVVHPE